MGREFIFDKFHTWLDWQLILTAKSVTPPEVKTYYVDIDGRSGSLDLSEALTGEISYQDRTVSASFWTDTGTYVERSALIRDIVTILNINQRIIAGNAQFAGIAAGRGVRFTTGLLLLGKGLGMRETPIRPHS